MAAEFIGYSILVTLRNPAGCQIDGVVSDVINQKLYLRNVHLKWNGQHLPSYILDASDIVDLEIAPEKVDEVPTPTAPPQRPPQAAPVFVDPAILSYNRNARPPQLSAPQTPVSPVMIADGAVPSPARFTPQRNLRGQSSISSIATARKASRRDSSATATLTEPFDALAMEESKRDAQQAENADKRKSQTGPGIIDLKDVLLPLKQNKKQPGKGRGWRNTPLIEEKPRPVRKQRGRQAAEDPNGWATEDATDIADMGDFDFEGNHAKFDKRKVFDDIRRDDTTADEERLVSFNRNKPRQGTNGGRNLHFTENVLDIPDTQDANRWKSEAGETEDEILRDEHYSSGRNSRRGGSRARPLPSRKGSVAPNHADRKEPSPRPLTRLPTASPMNGSVSGTKAAFRVVSNNKPCHAVSPLQMLELEQLCTSELGLTEDMLTENAGRAVAEAVLKSSTLATMSTTIQPQPSEIKNVLFLLGNHKSAARALAAARHLRNRRLRVTVCLLGLERGEDQLLEIVRKQLKVYRLSLGHVERWEDYQAKLANSAASTATGAAAAHSMVHPPDFIVDSLLGVHHAFDELRTDDQATVFSMVKWANLSAGKLAARSGSAASVPILSIDVPSGLSATSGIIAEADSQPLVMSSSQIVCLGAPKAGLLAFMMSDHHHAAIDPSVWAVCVADIGLSLVAWQRNGSRRKQGVEFGGEWVLPLKLV